MVQTSGHFFISKPSQLLKKTDQQRGLTSTWGQFIPTFTVRKLSLYVKEDITYEQYLERIEKVGQEEEERGAAYGGTYARNRVFDFAQKILDRERDRVYELSLSDAKKQYAQERQKAEEAIDLS